MLQRCFGVTVGHSRPWYRVTIVGLAALRSQQLSFDVRSQLVGLSLCRVTVGNCCWVTQFGSSVVSLVGGLALGPINSLRFGAVLHIVGLEWGHS